MSLTAKVEVPPRDREVLASWVRSPSIRAGLAQRARDCAAGRGRDRANEIVRRTGVSKADGDRVEEAVCRRGDLRAGGPAEAGQAAGHRRCGDWLTTLEPPPRRLGVTQSSSRLLAAELGMSNVKVADVWRERGLQPRRAEGFKFSTDPRLEAKVRDVVGLYLNPPDKAIVLCVDEKP
jgi:hypothetical protein